MKNNRRIKVLHLISGDLWAGAEAQAEMLLSWLKRNPELEVSAIIFNEGRLSQRLKSLDIPVYVLDERRDNSFLLFMKVRKVLSKDRIQILHTHRYKENVIGGLASALSGVPCLVQTAHGSSEPFRGIKKIKADLYDLLDRWTTISLFHKIIVVSSQQGEMFKERLNGSRTVCIHNGVDLQKIKAKRSRIEVRRDLGIGEDSPLIGTAGRLVPVKGLNYLLRAAKLMHRESPGLKVLMIGKGPERKSLEDTVSKLGIGSQVIFTGEREDVYDLISATDLLVLPSLSEGLPMVLLEALALEVPVVASAAGGIPEVITHGSTGFLVQPKEERALAEACLYLLENRAQARALAREGKKLVRTKFSAEVMAQKVFHLYEDLVR
jgi:glycosyltransferase involved in cell wall biosynthesis